MANGQPRAAEPGLGPRLALAAAALAVVVAGVRAAAAPATWGAGPWHAHGVPLGIGLELVLAALLAALELRRRRSPAAAQPAAGLRAVLRALLVTGVIAIPVLILISSAGNLRPARQRPLPSPRRLRLPPGRLHAHAAAAGSGADAALVLDVLLALVLLAIVAAAVMLLRRRARGPAWADLGEVSGDEPQEQLRRAVQSGQAALREIDDARLAIIACYLAMERSLGRAGAIREAAETPDELLGRASAAGLVHGGEAAALTALFYEARFSSHRLPPARREEARRALAVLAASLDVRLADAGPGAEPGAGPDGVGRGGAR